MFSAFTQEELKILGIMVGLSAIPAIIWSYLIFHGRKTSRWALLLAFFLGTLTVLPLILLYDYVWARFPDFNIYSIIEQNVTVAYLASVLTLIVVGILEELTKSGVVRFIDKTRIGIQTINDAVKYSILAGLGFAFTENIFYFYQIWQGGGSLVEIVSPMIFRSIFTVCGHMVFSGIFGYFYGIAKFSKPILEARLWMGERSWDTRILSFILGTGEANIFRQVTMMKGLLLAMGIHATFNFMLELEQFFPVLGIVGIGFLYLMYLLAHKAGDIVFTGTEGSSKMAKRDTDVVLELLGMWTREERYQDVIDICQRLLMRDPDNKVVQLFQAKAMDGEKLSKLEKSFTSLFESKDTKTEDKSLRALVRGKVLMEMLKEKQPQMQTQNTVQPSKPTEGGPKIPHVPGLANMQIDPSSQPENL